MLRNHLTFRHHIIYVDFNVLSQLRLKYPCHHSLICGSYILQTEWHYFVMVVPDRSNKSSLLLIIQGQRYLMITLEGIQETHPKMADSGIYQLVYLGHRKWILGASFI